MDHLRIFWESAGWKIAMGMRSGQSVLWEVTTGVMADEDLFNEAMSKELPRETKTPATKKRAATDEGGQLLQ